MSEIQKNIDIEEEMERRELEKLAAKNKKKYQLKQAALNKLTEEEKKVLGVKWVFV